MSQTSILTAISAYLGISEYLALKFAENAPTKYRKYDIPKKKGGTREIYHPAKETKALQIAAIDLLNSKSLIFGDCVKGYIRKVSSPLLKNALVHAKYNFTLKLDFKDFFPSIKKSDFIKNCKDRLRLYDSKLTEKDIDILSNLFFVYDKNKEYFLGIGAPSSPFVSNWIMYDIDANIFKICENNECVYTRYADDIYISGNSIHYLVKTEKEIKHFIDKHEHPKLIFNKNKRALTSKQTRRRVTGLTITPKGEVKIPRHNKRYIRSLIFKYKNSSLNKKESSYLSGYLAFIKDCEPDYLNNLVNKYGADTIHSVMNYKK